MKKDLTEGFSGKCLLLFSCTGADPLNGATVSLSYIDVPHQTKITMEYDGLGDTSNTSAKLDLSHYALFFLHRHQNAVRPEGVLGCPPCNGSCNELLPTVEACGSWRRFKPQ